MNWLRRWERLVRSEILATPFVVTNLLTRYEILGRENLETALAERQRRGCGMISISNHLSLFDDPMVFAELLGRRSFNVENKIWWSTPCESNFNPRGRGLAPGFVRYFSDVSNMVFFTRPTKVGHAIPLPDAYAPALMARGGPELVGRLEAEAARRGLPDVESLLRTYLTADPEHEGSSALDQTGMIEACARVGVGDWLHFFPEGTRSRTLHLKAPRKGVGKVIAFNPEALILPICFYGTQDVLPVKARAPRPFKRIVVTVGKPFEARRAIPRRASAPTPGFFQAVIDRAWTSVTTLRPMTLARYLGPAQAEALLRAEAPAAAAFAGERVGLPAQSPAPQRPQPRPERLTADGF
jgi:1-acyl-sn-glycerol-3-phosphate acyltransferase